MRSSKSRSRSKQNRNRSVGNIINRVFDSSGPEGKVRGTPQQIIDKYNQLARDAQLGNDRVAAENFQQHSEHYTRMLGEAMREMEAQRQQSGGGQGNGDGQPRDQPPPRETQMREQQPREQQPREQQVREQPAREPRQDREDRGETRPPRDIAAELPAFVSQPMQPRSEAPEAFAVDEGTAEESGLVETPESAPRPTGRSRSRRPRNTGEGERQGNPSEAAE